jgi:hypothetical protein
MSAQNPEQIQDYKLPTVVYPTMSMPTPPDVEHNRGGQGPRPDCEGFVTVLPDPKNSTAKPPPEGKVRVLIGIPMLDIKFEFLESFLRFWTELALETRKPECPYEVGYHFAYRKPVHMAEEYLVNVAQNSKCTHLLLMDDDIYDVTKDHFEKLLFASKFPHAMCVFRRFVPERKVIDMPADNSMYRLYEIPCLCSNCKTGQSHWDGMFCATCGSKQDNLIQQADLIPFALTMIDLKVFDKIKRPWFHCTNEYPTDSWFADRVLEAGYHEYAHMAVRLNHAGINDFTRPHYIQMGMAKAQQGQGVINLSPEEMAKHQFMLNNKMKEAETRMHPKPPFAGDPITQNLGQGQSMTLVTHGT